MCVTMPQAPPWIKAPYADAVHLVTRGHTWPREVVEARPWLIRVARPPRSPAMVGSNPTASPGTIDYERAL